MRLPGSEKASEWVHPGHWHTRGLVGGGDGVGTVTEHGGVGSAWW